KTSTLFKLSTRPDHKTDLHAKFRRALKEIELPREVDIVWARLERCKDHFKSFGTTWAEHLDSQPHSPKVEVDKDGNGRLILIRHREPPLVLSLFLGEFL